MQNKHLFSFWGIPTYGGGSSRLSQIPNFYRQFVLVASIWQGNNGSYPVTLVTWSESYKSVDIAGCRHRRGLLLGHYCGFGDIIGPLWQWVGGLLPPRRSSGWPPPRRSMGSALFPAFLALSPYSTSVSQTSSNSIAFFARLKGMGWVGEVHCTMSPL